MRNAAYKTLASRCDSILLRTRMPPSCCTGKETEDTHFTPILKVRKLKHGERLRDLFYITQLGSSITEYRPMLVQSQVCPCNLCLPRGIEQGREGCRDLGEHARGKLLIKNQRVAIPAPQNLRQENSVFGGHPGLCSKTPSQHTTNQQSLTDPLLS